MAKNDKLTDTADKVETPAEAQSGADMTRDEMQELLRYYIGSPPYIQDRRFRDLYDSFSAADSRPVAEDARTPQGQLEAYQNADASNA